MGRTRSLFAAAHLGLLVAALFFCALQQASADNGLAYLNTPTLWPYGTAQNQIGGDAGFLAVKRDPANGWTYWGSRDWMGLVADKNPSNTSAISRILFNSDVNSDPSYAHIELQTSGPLAGSGWFASINNQDLWRFNLSDPAPVPIKYYDRLFDNRLFRGFTFEPTQQIFWVITDNDVIWIDPALPPQSVEQANPPNGRLQNIQNGASMRLIMKQTSTNSMIMAGNAIVLKTPATNNAFTGVWRRTELTSRQVGAGLYLCGVINQDFNVLYLGSDLGIGIEVTLSTLALNRIFFAPNEVFYTVLFDPKGATFWSTNRGNVIRVNSIDFAIFAREAIPAVTNLQAATQDDSGIITYGANFGQDFNTYTVLKTDCNYDCGACLSFDRQYCGVCKSSGACTVAEQCPTNTGDVWQRDGICPAARTITPASANTNGGTIVTIQGTVFEDPSTHRCAFYTDADNPLLSPVLSLNTAVNPPYVTCAVPAVLDQTSATSTINVGIRWVNGSTTTRPWGGVLPFTYYKCDVLKCQECFSTSDAGRIYPECVWCVRNITCASAGVCDASLPNNLRTDNCPTISSVTPGVSVSTGGVPITVAMNYPLPTEWSYVCEFNTTPNAQLMTASRVGDSLTCTTPLNIQSSAVASVALRISRDTATPNGGLVVPRDTPFEFYDCNGLQSCSECLTYPSCKWCGNTDLKCQPQSVSCAANNPFTSPSSCPKPTNVVPASKYIPVSGYAPQTVTIKGTGFENYGAGAFCQWTKVGDAAPTDSTPATYVSPTDLTCATPTAAPVTGDYLVTIVVSSKPQAAGVPFLFYSCDAQSCLSCLDPRRTQCIWCNSGAYGERLQCGLDPFSSCATGAISANSGCPTLTSVSPNGDSTDGMRPLTLTGAFSLNAGAPNVSCEWLSASTLTRITSAPATVVDSSTVTCSSPQISAGGSARIRVLQDSLAYTDVLPFTYYNCSLQTTCGSCLSAQFSACVWCGTSCTSAVSCPAAKRISGTSSSCPQLQSVSPTFTIVDGGDLVTVTGGPFIPDDTATYRCSIGGLDTLGRAASNTTVECTTPRRSSGTTNVKVFVDGVDYTPGNELSLEFFSCPTIATSSCTAECSTNHTYCGWCVSQSTCTGKARCPALWLDQCLRAEFAPGSNHASLKGNEIIEVKVDITGENGAQFGNFLPSDLTCVWFNTFVSYQLPAVQILRDEVTGATTGIRCKTPSVSIDQSVSFTVRYQNGDLFKEMPFVFIDCNPANEPRCETCLARKPYCGWCLDSNLCSTNGTCFSDTTCVPGAEGCTAGSGSWVNNLCPRITLLQPRAFADIAGGSELYVVGENFVTGGRLWVVFNDTQYSVKADVFNSTHLKCLVPKGPAVMDTILTLRHRINETAPMKVFTTNSVPFAWVLTPTVDIVAVAVGVGVAVLVIVVAMIIAIVYVRRKYADAINVRVVEPDYIAVAFGNDVDLKYKMPDDNYKNLEALLARRDFGLQLAIQSFCPPTEQDLVAKAMIHVAHTQDKAIDLINTLVRVEVAQCIQENTIFRGNSLVSKMFKFYSRIAGIKYMFRSIARVIAELETLGRKELRKKAEGPDTGKKKGEASLLNMTMELDDNKLSKEGDIDVDLDTNILQLQLTCQKLFGVIVKSSAAGFPIEFRRIFVQIDQAVLQRFGSDDAAFKAIGGFFFLRFVCPAITAPHVYGLLQTPPNELTQRQLVLISKVLQSLANMAVPGKKEKYMATLASFIEQNIPKMAKFYDEIRKPGAMQGEPTDIEVPKDVKFNALGTLWGFIFLNQEKIQSAIFAETVGLEKTTAREVSDTLEELIYNYKTGPKKLDVKKKKGAKPAAAPVPDV